MSPSPLGVEPLPPSQPSITVLAADSQDIVREGIKALLSTQPDMRVIGEAADWPTVLVLAKDLNPGVVVTEVTLPGMSGVGVLDGLKQKALVLTACEWFAPHKALEGGASVYVLKRFSVTQLVPAIRAVAAGQIYLDPELEKRHGPPARASELSEREEQVLRLISLGYSNKEIAAQFKLSTQTIDTFKTRAMKKLGAHSRVDLIRHAIRSGWLTEAR